jgi:hypothetical protein
MNRRRFCLKFAASLVSAMGGPAWAKCVAGPRSAAAGDSGDPYALWSLLLSIQRCQCSSVRGVLIAANSAVPDSLPSLQTGKAKSAIERAIEATRHPEASYDTDVPTEWRGPFEEAVAEAKLKRAETIVLERRFTLPKRYRLLSQDEINAYFALSPHTVPAGWRPDPKAVREYKGWDDLSYISLPYFDIAQKLAMIWMRTEGGGCSTTSWYFFTRSGQEWTRESWNTDRRDVCA